MDTGPPLTVRFGGSNCPANVFRDTLAVPGTTVRLNGPNCPASRFNDTDAGPGVTVSDGIAAWKVSNDMSTCTAPTSAPLIPPHSIEPRPARSASMVTCNASGLNCPYRAFRATLTGPPDTVNPNGSN